MRQGSHWGRLGGRRKDRGTHLAVMTRSWPSLMSPRLVQEDGRRGEGGDGKGAGLGTLRARTGRRNLLGRFLAVDLFPLATGHTPHSHTPTASRHAADADEDGALFQRAKILGKVKRVIEAT